MLSLKFLYDSPIGAFIMGWKKKRLKNVVKPAKDDPSLCEDPFRASYIESIPEAQIYRGVLLQGYLVLPNILVGLEDMEIREDDVFIITYPKSGTTWTEEIVSLIFNNGDIRKVKKELLFYRAHHLEVGRPLGHLRYIKNLKSPRLMATHLPFPLLPRQLRESKCKIIYVVRNPKDTAVSYYHHHKISTFLGNYSGTWDDFLAHFMAGHVVYGSWFNHVLSYWQFCKDHPDKVFFVAYEELKMDLKNMVEALCDFLGKDILESSLEDICKHCSFEEMKSNRMVNREKLPISDMFDMSKSKFMRKGIIGDWKNYFSPEQSKLFDECYKEKVSDSGLDIVFEPEEATERILTYGRVICNHPKKDEIPWVQEKLQNDDESISSEDDPNEICFTKPRYIMPPLQVHLQPDPLVIDFVY